LLVHAVTQLRSPALGSCPPARPTPPRRHAGRKPCTPRACLSVPDQHTVHGTCTIRSPARASSSRTALPPPLLVVVVVAAAPVPSASAQNKCTSAKGTRSQKCRERSACARTAASSPCTCRCCCCCCCCCFCSCCSGKDCRGGPAPPPSVAIDVAARLKVDRSMWPRCRRMRRRSACHGLPCRRAACGRRWRRRCSRGWRWRRRCC
jgi:hypothetical protein